MYPYGATLNVSKSSVAILGTGTACFPLQRPVCALNQRPNSGRIVVLASCHMLSDLYIDKEENNKIQVWVVVFSLPNGKSCQTNVGCQCSSWTIIRLIVVISHVGHHLSTLDPGRRKTESNRRSRPRCYRLHHGTWHWLSSGQTVRLLGRKRGVTGGLYETLRTQLVQAGQCCPTDGETAEFRDVFLFSLTLVSFEYSHLKQYRKSLSNAVA